MAAKKNILLIIADDLTRDLSIYGYENTVKTPALEALARQGTVFDNAFASTASCSGSRSTIYTGLHTHQNGQYGLNRGYKRLHYFTTFDEIETQPSIFNGLGYFTQIVAKLHVGPIENYPFHVHNKDPEHSRDGQWIAQQLEDGILRAQSEDVPFFTTVGFIDPHRDPTRAGFGNRNDYPGIKQHKYDPEAVQIPDYLSDVPAVRRELAHYYQAIDRMDQGVAMLMDVLERKGVANSTLVVFLSDNGPPFVNSKTTLYDAGIRLPLIIRRPGQEGGKRSPNMVSYLDLLPTFLDWAEKPNLPCKNPKGTKRRGRSLLPILELEQDHQDWRHIFCSHTFHEISSYYPTRVMRTKKFKYHRNIAWQLPFPFGGDLYGATSFEDMRNHQPDGPGAVRLGKRLIKDYIYRPPEMLFDIENDPNELNNLADNPDYQDVLTDMRQTLEQWQRETGDQWLFKDGISIGCINNHIEHGCKVPDRFDFDVENPGSDGVPLVKKKDLINRW